MSHEFDTETYGNCNCEQCTRLRAEDALKGQSLSAAVRELLYGNGDLMKQIEDVAEALSKEDGCKPKGPTKLELIAARLSHLEEYDWFSGEEWNE